VGLVEVVKTFVTLVPDAATTDSERLDRFCHCDACERDGQHEPTCSVHEEPPGKCDCHRSDR
jgi:hypothetical protein